MTTWFHNVQFTCEGTLTSRVLDNTFALLREYGYDPREFSVKHSDKEMTFDIRIGLLGVSGSPLASYRELKRMLQSHFDEVLFDSYTIANGTVNFLVSEHLDKGE